MLVTEVKTYLVDPGRGKNWLFVKVQTDEGVHGWGEAYTTPDKETSLEVLVKQVGQYLIGRSPFNIKHFMQVIYRDFAIKRGTMDLFCAQSAIEQALWDIVGKAAGMPVYNLLGGACRDRIRVYGHCGGPTPEAVAEGAREVVNMGFTAVKFDPFPGPWTPFISREDERAAVEEVRAVREAVGPKVDILIEVHRRLAPMHAIRVAAMLEEFDVFWYEEPVDAENLDALAEVRRNVRLPVVTGEALYTKHDFREVFEKGAADIINPDICNCGGILELKEIAAMAEPYYVAVAPHNNNSTAIGLAASVQLAACIPNFLILEYFIGARPRSDEISIEPLRVENGYIRLPTAPGLGLDLDEEAMARHPYRESPKRSLRQYYEEGP